MSDYIERCQMCDIAIDPDTQDVRILVSLTDFSKLFCSRAHADEYELKNGPRYLEP